MVELLVADQFERPGPPPQVKQIIGGVLCRLAGNDFEVERVRKADCTVEQARQGRKMACARTPYTMCIGNPTQNAARNYFGVTTEFQRRLRHVLARAEMLDDP